MRIPLFAVAAALLAAAPAAAQPFRSDVTGPHITGSGVAGVSFHGAAFRDIENALFRRAQGRVVFRSRGIAARMRAQADTGAAALRQGTIQPPRDWDGSVPLTPEAQAAVLSLLTNAGTDTPEARRVVAALRGGVPGEPGDEAEQLVAALAGLFLVPEEPVGRRGQYVAGERWAAAFQAYENFVQNAPDTSLDPLTPELGAIGAVVRDLVDAGLSAARR